MDEEQILLTIDLILHRTPDLGTFSSEKGQMGSCGMYGEKRNATYWWGVLKERDYLKDLGIYVTVLCKCGVDWMSVDHGADKCLAVLTRALKLRVL